MAGLADVTDTRSLYRKHLGIELVEVSRRRLNGAGADMGEVRGSLSRVKFGETKSAPEKSAQPDIESPDLKPRAHPQRGKLRNSNRTGKTEWG